MGSFDVTLIRDIVIVLVPMILSLTVHEFAHAWSAHKLGDDTARAEGRMTLNPLPHIDLFGTVLLPAMSVVFGGIAFIGWAKPVPVSPHRFHRGVTMRTGMMITAFAGPASNIVLAFIVAGVAMVLYGDQIGEVAADPRIGSVFGSFMILGSHENASAIAESGLMSQGGATTVFLLSRIFAMNLGLAMFNMLPVPPLDGSRILPLSIQEKFARYWMFTFFGLLIAINFLGGLLAVPVEWLGNAIMAFWSLLF